MLQLKYKHIHTCLHLDGQTLEKKITDIEIWKNKTQIL